MLTQIQSRSLMKSISANSKSSLQDLTTWKLDAGSIPWSTKSTTLPKVRKEWQLFWSMAVPRDSKGKPEWSFPMSRHVTSALWIRCLLTILTPCVQSRRPRGYPNIASNTQWSLSGRSTSRGLSTRIVRMIWPGSVRKLRKELTSMVSRASITIRQWVSSKTSYRLLLQRTHLSPQLVS